MNRVRLVLLALVVSFTASGCVAYVGVPTMSTFGDMSGVRMTAAGCANGATAGNPRGGTCGNSNNGPGAGRFVVGLQLPTFVNGPSGITATTNVGGDTVAPYDLAGPTSNTVALVQNASVASFMQSHAPAPAGSQWVGYLSELVIYPIGSPITGSTTFDLSILRTADGSLGAPTIDWRMAYDYIQYNQFTPEYGGETSATEWNCSFQCTPYVYPVAGSSSFVPRTLTVGPSDAVVRQIVRGANATLPYNLALRGGVMGGTGIVTLNARSLTTGVQAIANTTTVAPVNGLNTPADVNVFVAANAPLGRTAVELVATTANGEVRTGTAQVDIVDPPVATDTKPPVTTVKSKLLTGKRIGIFGVAIDPVPVPSGIAKVQVQLTRSIGKGKCQVLTARKVTTTTCVAAGKVWLTAALAKTGTAKRAWAFNTRALTVGRWSVKARAIDRGSRIGRAAATSRVVTAPRR